MSRFNTGNPLGSGDPRDLDDNAKNMDLAVNSDELRWSDRFGRDRKSFEGMEREFESAQDSRDNAFESAQTYRESRFNDFIASSGYQFAGDYAPGIEITEYNQLVRDEDGEFWRVSGQVDLPYVTTGAGIPEGDALVPAGDAVLRQDLANPDIGAAMVARGVVAVDSIADLLALPPGQRREGLRYLVKGYHVGSDVGGGVFFWRDSGGEDADGVTSYSEPGRVDCFIRQRSGLVSVQDAGAIGDGVTPDSPSIQKMATLVDASRARYVYIPNWNENYRIEGPITLRYPGVRVFGDQGGTYNRGKGKSGWLLGAPGLTHILDLGDSRSRATELNESDHNPADHWQVDGLSFKRAADSVERTVDGIRFTTRSNGPDRGGRVRNCSFIGLNNGITVENPDIATVMATIDIEGCVFQSCDSAINAKGMTFGLRFVGNQCEQNGGADGAGVIRGSLNGPVTIADNMLEGQPNVISVDIPAATGNRPHVLVRGNYYEANSGDYVHRFRTNSSQASLEVGPNFHQAITATDYVLLEGSQGAALITMKDEYPLAFKGSSMWVKHGSSIFPGAVNHFKLYPLTITGPKVIIGDYGKLFSDEDGYVHADFQGQAPSSTYAERSTPHGARICAVAPQYTILPVAVEPGDLVVVNMLVRSEVLTGSGTVSCQLWNNTLSSLVRETGPTSLAAMLGGKWALVSLSFVANIAAPSLRLRLSPVSGTTDTALLGVSAKNYGPFIEGAAKEIRPVAPRLSPVTSPAA